jgi:23S rRNA maturation-related 3'-5' exoribonuclease YhaM
MSDSSRYIDFETKKTIHFNITRESHSRLRIECFQRRLSMQEVFEELTQLIAEESPVLLRILDNLSEKKRSRVIKKLSETDAESLFNIIEKENPLSEQE